MLENINTKKAVDIEASQITMNWSLERYLLTSSDYEFWLIPKQILNELIFK